MLVFSHIIDQVDTRIIISIQKIKFFIEENVIVNLYSLLSSASGFDVNRPFLSLFIFINNIDLINVTEKFF